MPSATLTSKGQITIPVTVRQAMGLEIGQRVDFVRMPNQQFQLVAVNRSAAALKGIVQTQRSVSLEEMEEAIAIEALSLDKRCED